MSAIKAVIAAQFDATGLKKATKEFGKLGGSIKGALGAVGIGIGIAAITSGLKEATKAAVMDAKSQGLLAQQLKNTAAATDTAIAANEAFISSLELSANIADDNLRPAMASLVRATGDVGKAQTLLALSTDVAAGTGRDLGSVAIAVGRAANGQTTALRRLGIVVKDGQDPIQALTAAFKGNAEAAADLDPFQRLSIIFGRIQEQVGAALVPTLQQFATFLASPEGQGKIKQFVDAIVIALGLLVKFIDFIAANFDTLTKLGTIIGTVAIAMGVLNIALNTNPIILAISAVGLLVTAFMALNGQINLVNNATPKNAVEAGQQAFDASMRSAERNPIFGRPYNESEARFNAEAARRAAIKQFKIDAQTRGEAARFGALVNQGLSSTAVTFDPFAGVTGGSKALTDAAKKSADIAKKAADEAQKAIDAQDELVADFTKNILELSEAFRGLGESSKELGQFEQQASSAFDALNDEIKKGLNDRAITNAAAKFLFDYVAVERAALTALARQRDVLLARIEIAKDISRGVVDAVNITGLLTNETRQVTKSVKTLVNGIATTISSTYDEVVTGNLADSFKKLVDRTKNFAKNLVTLKKLGLNGTLFKQIVDAGSEAGGATAEAIIAGGADTVTELNGLFDELNKAGSDIAKESTDVFYDLGEGVSNAFIDGLKSQEAILAAQIASMVASIEAAFASMMARLNQLGAAPMTNANGFAYETALPGVSGSASQFGSATPWAQAVASFRQSQAPTVNNYITVKTSAIVSEKSAGQLFTSLQNKYTKASG